MKVLRYGVIYEITVIRRVGPLADRLLKEQPVKGKGAKGCIVSSLLLPAVTAARNTLRRPFLPRGHPAATTIRCRLVPPR